jgi:hypothetical protein
VTVAEGWPEEEETGNAPSTEEIRLRSLFRATSPASLPEAADEGGTLSKIHVPENFRHHWEKVPELLKRFPILMRPFQGVCMTPTEEYQGKMCGESKCFSMIDSKNIANLAGPYDGVTYTFLSKCLSGIPDISMKTLFFFDNCLKVLRQGDRSPYVFPTDKIGLTVRFVFPC